MELKQTGISGGNALLVAACLVVVVAGLKLSAGLVLPFLIALFVAAISLPLLHAMQRRGVPTWLAVLVTIIADLVALGGMVALIGGSVADFTAQVRCRDTRPPCARMSSNCWTGRAPGVYRSPTRSSRTCSTPAAC